MTATVEARLARLETEVATPRKQANMSARGDFGWNVEEVKERVKRPAARGPREYEQLRRITGIYVGPEDLSKTTRNYINGDRERNG